MDKFLQEVAPGKAYRLLNLGATCFVSAAFNGDGDVMPAAWNCALDLAPCKCTVVVARDHYTRPLMEKSGYFAISLPTVSIAKVVMQLGSVSKNDVKDKLEQSDAKFFKLDGFDMPLVSGCAAHLIFKIIPEPEMEQKYDLFLGECVKAVADSRVFRNGHYYYDASNQDLRTLHYVAGGHFYALGEEVLVPGYDD